MCSRPTFVAYQHMECVNSISLIDVWGFHALTESENLGKWIATASAPNLERIVLLLLLRKHLQTLINNIESVCNAPNKLSEPLA